MYIFMHMCVFFFIHSSVNRHLGCFHVLAIINNAAINIKRHVSFQASAYVSFGLICKGGIAGSPWPPDAKSWLIGKDPDAGRDREQDEKRATEDEMVGWHHWLNGHELEQT